MEYPEVYNPMPQQFQEPPPVDDGFYYNPQKTEDRKITIIKELKLTQEVEIFEMKLRGFDWNIMKKEWERKREPDMNEYGISWVMNALNVSTDAVTLSYYKLEDIPGRVKHIMKRLVPVIHVYYKDFGISNKSKIPLITAKLFHFTEACFRKGAGGGDRKVIKDTMYEDLSMPKQGGQRESFFDKINPFAKQT